MNRNSPSAVLLRVVKTQIGPKKFSYSVISSPSHGLIHLNSSEFTIGRDRQGCQYFFDTLDVSRKHVVFKYGNNGWTITDLSSHGTWLSIQDSHYKLEKNVATPLQNMYIITLKPSPEIRYLFIENVYPTDIPLPSSGSMSLFELSKSIFCRNLSGEKRRYNDSNSDVPEKRFRHEASCSEQGKDNLTELAIIQEEQARLINELKNKSSLQSKLIENYTCSICLQVVVRPTTLIPCQHVYCHKCISEFRERICSQRAIMFCPMCRSQPSYFFLNKNLEVTIDLVLQSSLTDQEMIERKRTEKEYLEGEKTISNFFKTVQSQMCLPPVVLTDSNEIQEIEDLEDFLATVHPDVDDSDDSADSDSDASNIDIAEIQEFLESDFQIQEFLESEQNILYTSSY